MSETIDRILKRRTKILDHYAKGTPCRDDLTSSPPNKKQFRK